MMTAEHGFVTARSREPAPNEEWILMYRGGLPGSRIAELTGLSVSTSAITCASPAPPSAGRETRHAGNGKAPLVRG
jgi:hypothetical protein